MKKILIPLVIVALAVGAYAAFNYFYLPTPSSNVGAISTQEVTADECFVGESYDAATDSCYVNISCETEEECNDILEDLYADHDYVELEDWDMTAQDCLAGEEYDAEEKACYIECETEEECQAKSAEVYQNLDVYFDEGFAGHSQAAQDNEIPPIAKYSIDEQLNINLLETDPNASSEYANYARHEEIWSFLSQILPKNYIREETKEYHVFTDGPSETLAFVAPLESDKTRWLIGVDIEDSGLRGELGGKLGQKEFIHTIVHEFAHILTLENDQVPPDTTEASEDELSDGEKACRTYYPGEGCANPKSYINLFYQRFWSDIYSEYDEAVNFAETDEEYYDNAAAFYEKYEDRFVSEYAATNPGEDIADTFAFFVLKEKPTGESIADQKVRFMYQFDQLVDIRSYIRQQLARATN